MAKPDDVAAPKSGAPWSDASTTPDPRRRWALAATSIGLFMAMLDVNVVVVALPTIGPDLKVSFADPQWTLNAYALALAVLFVTAGGLGDIFGRKRAFMVGLGLFSLGSLLCALAGGIHIVGAAPIRVLIGARALQGLGGALVAHLSWQSIFYLNVPIGLVGILLAAWAVRESRDEKAPRTVDFFGLATLTISLFCMVLALSAGLRFLPLSGMVSFAAPLSGAPPTAWGPSRSSS